MKKIALIVLTLLPIPTGLQAAFCGICDSIITAESQTADASWFSACDHHAQVHLNCLQLWLAYSRHSICPCCRQPLQVPQENQLSADQKKILEHDPRMANIVALANPLSRKTCQNLLHSGTTEVAGKNALRKHLCIYVAGGNAFCWECGETRLIFKQHCQLPNCKHHYFCQTHGGNNLQVCPKFEASLRQTEDVFAPLEVIEPQDLLSLPPAHLICLSRRLQQRLTQFKTATIGSEDENSTGERNTNL